MTVATRTVRLANFKCISGAVLEHRKRYRISARFVSRLRNGNILNLFLFSKFIIIVVCIFFQRWTVGVARFSRCWRVSVELSAAAFLSASHCIRLISFQFLLVLGWLSRYPRCNFQWNLYQFIGKYAFVMYFFYSFRCVCNWQIMSVYSLKLCFLRFSQLSGTQRVPLVFRFFVVRAFSDNLVYISLKIIDAHFGAFCLSEGTHIWEFAFCKCFWSFDRRLHHERICFR